MIINRRL